MAVTDSWTVQQTDETDKHDDSFFRHLTTELQKLIND